jgi:acetoin utilization protein AcuC
VLLSASTEALLYRKKEGLSKMKVGIIYSDKLKNYDFGPEHPFRGDRFESFMSYFNIKLSTSGRFEVILNEESASNNDLMLWHTRDYIHAMERTSSGAEVSDLFKYVSSDNVNPLTGRFPAGIESVARVIVKNSLLACELVMEEKFEKVISIGGGLHHAKPGFGEGFCVYNDVAICAKHAIKKYSLNRVLVLDTDAHAGNGTCQAFYSDPRVLFVDLHQKDIYPGTGYEDEIGEGKGKGFTANVPLPPYAGDESYRYVFDELIFPLVEEFNPQLVIRNGGSDPHPSDEITQLGLTLEGFRYIGKSVRKIAEICDGKEVDLICSGYKPEVLSRAWSALISGLAGIDITLEEPFILRTTKNQRIGIVKNTVNHVKKKLKPYWRSLNS